MPSHYLNQFWNVVNWTPRNNLQWNFNRSSYIFIQEMNLKMVSGNWQPFCLGPNVLTAYGLEMPCSGLVWWLQVQVKACSLKSLPFGAGFNKLICIKLSPEPAVNAEVSFMKPLPLVTGWGHVFFIKNVCNFQEPCQYVPSPNQALVSEIYGKTEYSKTGWYTTHK